MTAIEVCIKGVVFGVGAAAPIGPVNLEMARRVLSRGWANGACLGLGAVSVDVVYACAAVAGVSVAAGSPWVFWPLAVGGTYLLVYLAVGSIYSAGRAMKTGWQVSGDGLQPTDGHTSVRALVRCYATGVLMTAVNPMTLIFWFGGLSSQALAQGIAADRLIFLALGVFLGTTAWVVSFSSLMSLLGRFRKPWWMAAADLLGGLVLLAFAARSVVGCLYRWHGVGPG